MLLSTWTLVLAGLAALVAGWMSWRRRNWRLLQLAAQLPGPPALPLLGNALYLIGRKADILTTITWFMRTYGEYVRIWMGPELQVCVSNPLDVRYMLMSNKINEKGKFYSVLAEILGPGLVTGGPTWRDHRKICKPVYNKQINPVFNATFNEEADLLIADLAKIDPHVTVNLFTDVHKSITQCVCRTLMGLSKEDSMNLNRLDEVFEFTDDMYALAFAKIMTWYMWIPVVYKFMGYQKQADYYKNGVMDLAKDIVEKKRASLKAQSETATDSTGNTRVVQEFAVLKRFLQSNEFSNEELLDETYSLLIASQESSSKIASCLLLFLAHLPEWQEKVYNELLDTIGEDRHLKEEDLKDLVALDAVFKEALRYLPTAVCLQRTATEDITLQQKKVTIPAGTQVVMPIHAMHRDPKYWDEPDKVKPERFFSYDGKKKEPAAFLPFSHGAMDCLGRQLAASLVKILAARVVWNYQLSADGRVEDLELDVAISTRFKHGTNMRVQRRARPAKIRDS